MIRKQPAKNYGFPCEIVLRTWGKNQWATHFHNLVDGGFYHGHYFSNYSDAIADFKKRVSKE